MRPVLAFLCGAAAYRALYRPFALSRGLGDSLLLDILLGGAAVGVVYLAFLFLTGQGSPCGQPRELRCGKGK